MTRGNAVSLGRRAGKVIEVDGGNGEAKCSKSFLNVKLDLEVSKTLISGAWVQKANG